MHALTQSKGGRHWVWNRERSPTEGDEASTGCEDSVGSGMFQAHFPSWERVGKLHSTAFPNPLSPAPFLLELCGSVDDFRRSDKVIWHRFLHNNVFLSFSSKWNLVFQELLLEDSLDFYLLWYPRAPTQNNRADHVSLLLLLLDPFLPMLASLLHAVSTRTQPGKLTFSNTMQSLETEVKIQE